MEDPVPCHEGLYQARSLSDGKFDLMFGRSDSEKGQANTTFSNDLYLLNNLELRNI